MATRRLPLPAPRSTVVMPDWVYDERDRRFMAEALAEAHAAAKLGEVPVRNNFV